MATRAPLTAAVLVAAALVVTVTRGGNEVSSPAPTLSTTTTTSGTTTTTVRDLGEARFSRIERLPVPASSIRSTGSLCHPVTMCREEHWTVPNASPADIRAWYATRLSRTEPWRHWRPCFPDHAARGELDPHYFGWFKHGPDRSLGIRISEEAPTIAILTVRVEMPCQ